MTRTATSFDMPKTGTWEERGGWVVRRLAADLGLRDFQAAGLVGNLGGETDGFKLMQEMRPQVAGSAGGYGWAQWTGPRRRAFEAWCAENLLRPEQDEANYSFLLYELNGGYSSFLRQLRRAASLAEATQLTHRLYETPQDVLDRTYTSYPKRLHFAERALAGAGDAAAEPIKAPKLTESAVKAFNKAALRLQKRLKADGLYDGALDGDFGLASRRALMSYLRKYHPQ